MSVEVIAEIGSSHDGNEAWAQELVAVAKQSGADAVKVQFWGDGEALANRRGLSEYAATYARYAVPKEWLPLLRDQAQNFGMRFVVTVFLPEDAPTVAAVADAIKVSSFEATDRALLNAIDKARQPNQRVIVSCGQGKSLDTAKEILGKDIVGLHCVSSYPVPEDELNLARIAEEKFSGYSDHSDPNGAHGDQIGAYAVAAGARIVEVHLRLDATPVENPDYAHSRNPAQFARYVENIRHARRRLGDGTSAARKSEAKWAKQNTSNDVTGKAGKR